MSHHHGHHYDCAWTELAHHFNTAGYASPGGLHPAPMHVTPARYHRKHGPVDSSVLNNVQTMMDRANAKAVEEERKKQRLKEQLENAKRAAKKRDEEEKSKKERSYPI